MKPRTVILTIEMVTDVPLKMLTDKTKLEVELYHSFVWPRRVPLTVRQARAQVAQPAKRKGDD